MKLLKTSFLAALVLGLSACSVNYEGTVCETYDEQTCQLIESIEVTSSDGDIKWLLTTDDGREVSIKTTDRTPDSAFENIMANYTNTLLAETGKVYLVFTQDDPQFTHSTGTNYQKVRFYDYEAKTKVAGVLVRN